MSGLAIRAYARPPNPVKHDAAHCTLVPSRYPSPLEVTMSQALESLLAAAVLAVSPVIALADQVPAPIQESETEVATATVEAIDQAARTLTLKNEEGEISTFKVPPEVERFSAIKVGDKVTARYIEAVAIQVRRSGEPATPQAAEEVAVVPRPGQKPGATISQQTTAKVTVQQIDTKRSALTVLKADGASLSFKVQDTKRLKGLKVGDQIEVTYTEAVLLTVDSPKP
jgi:Cu/Ag efflux protein CusF